MGRKIQLLNLIKRISQKRFIRSQKELRINLIKIKRSQKQRPKLTWKQCLGIISKHWKKILNLNPRINRQQLLISDRLKLKNQKIRKRNIITRRQISYGITLQKHQLNLHWKKNVRIIRQLKKIIRIIRNR